MEKQFFKTDLDRKFAQLDEVVSYFSEMNIILQSKSFVLPSTNPLFEKSLEAMGYQVAFQFDLETFLESISALKEDLYSIYNFEMGNKDNFIQVKQKFHE